MRWFLFLILFNSYLFAEYHIYGILKEFFYGNFMSFYNKDYGYVDCHILGVVSIDSANNKECKIDDKTFKIMQFEGRLYARELLYDEQKYRLIVYKNGCVIFNGSKLYNEQLIFDGYGIVRKKYQELSKQEREYIKKLKSLQDKAKAQKRGFWREFNKEMRCLESTN